MTLPQERLTGTMTGTPAAKLAPTDRRGEHVDARYELVRPLGSGSQATVWRARDLFLERDVALKILRPSADARLANDARFRREASMLARLRSPHLATVFAFGFHGSEPYFAMELIEGRSLFDLWRSHVREGLLMPLDRTIEIISAAARALSVAHAQGIVHRDVKPENVMIESDTGRVVLVDFGVARDVGDLHDGGIYGTLEYLSPEVLEGLEASAFSDQYGLALITYELLSGDLPFRSGGGLAEARARPQVFEPPSRRRPDLAVLDVPILRALSAQPGLRYPTCLGFGSALVEALTPPSVTIPLGGESGAIPQPGGALRVLVVDDDPLFVKLVTRCLQVALAGIPLAISRATDPLAALEKCKRRLPELVVLDYAMPGTDGVALLGHVRALPGAERVRAVVLSASADERVRGRFAMLGVRAFASKPIEFSALVDTLHTVARANGWIGGAEPA